MAGDRCVRFHPRFSAQAASPSLPSSTPFSSPARPHGSLEACGVLEFVSLSSWVASHISPFLTNVVGRLREWGTLLPLTLPCISSCFPGCSYLFFPNILYTDPLFSLVIFVATMAYTVSFPLSTGSQPSGKC